MKAGQKIRLEKRAAQPGREEPTEAQKFKYGQDVRALPLDYVMEGELFRDIEVGHSLVLLRHRRSGPDGTLVEVPGVVTTSRVLGIEQGFTGVELYTQNSVYVLNPIE